MRDGAFGVLNRLSLLSDTLRHHAADPNHPASLLDRQVVQGEPRAVASLLERAHDGLQSYDDGLRRYPGCDVSGIGGEPSAAARGGSI